MTDPQSILNPPPKAPEALRLTKGQIGLLMVFGAILWVLGIFQLRWAGAMGALTDGRTAIVYGVILLATVPLVAFAPKAVGLPPSARLHCATIIAAVAALLDGVAVRWTHIYADAPGLRANCAASLLWAIGVAVALGLIMSRSRSPAEP